MLRFNGRKKTVAIAAACALIAAAGAYAYWTSTGAGTGTASHASYVPITVVQTSTIAGLYPGGSAVTLSGNFNNTNAGKVRVGSVTVAFAATNPITGGSGGTPACTPSDYALEGTADVNAEVNTGTAQGAWTGLTVRMLDSATDQDACKGATLNLVYSSN